MNISNKQKEFFLTNDQLNQYYNKLDSIIKNKKLFLISNLSLNDLSSETNIKVEYIKQVLNKKLGLNFFNFISLYKIEKAKSLIINNLDNKFCVSDIAIKSGFNTKDSFCILFEKHTNTTPENYQIEHSIISNNEKIKSLY